MMRKIRPDGYLKRYENNPVITPRDFPYFPADATFNCGQTMYEGKTILLVSVVKRADRASIYVAESEDGINFKFHREPLITPLTDERFSFMDIWCIDPRVTRIDDTYYIIRPGNNPGGIGTDYMYKTKDFKTAEFVECVALSANRVPCLFPEKINGYYARLDRPYNIGASNEYGAIWVSYSPDLIHWGQHRFLFFGTDHWNWGKVGPTPPIKTEKGWLEIFHGAYTSCSTTKYSLGAMLLDLSDPTKIIGKMGSYLITPEEWYECSGNVPDVIFACGAIADFDTHKLRIYYGAADTSICLAVGDLDEIIDACLNGL